MATAQHKGTAFHRARSWLFFLSVVLPTIAGFLLLAFSVALLDTASPATVRSQTAIRLAGYLPIALIGFLATNTIVARLWYDFIIHQSRVTAPTRDVAQRIWNMIPSHILPFHDRWTFLPGGEGYSIYRKRRLDTTNA
jgi:hypothetical protein